MFQSLMFSCFLSSENIWNKCKDTDIYFSLAGKNIQKRRLRYKFTESWTYLNLFVYNSY